MRRKPPPGGLPVGLPRDLAEQLFRGALPAAFEPSSTADFLDYALKPGLDAARPDEFRATGTLAGASFDRDAADGVTTEVQTDEEPSCLTPTDVAAGASEPRLAGGAAALYANSHQSTDTIVRPSATGAFNLTQVRDATAPGALSWSVALQPGQQLAELPGGAVAVIEPAEEGTSAPETIECLPAPPDPAEQRRALNDTELQLRLVSDALERAQGENPDRVIGLMPPPWAKDKLGRAVATSLRASGSTVTMQIAHSALTPYPVVAGQEYVSRDSVDEYETLSALASVGDYAWEENSEPGPEPASAQRTAQAAAAAPGCDGVDDEVEPIAGQSADLPDDIPDVEDEGVGAVASAKAKRINRGNLKALKIGITAADPATIVNPDYSDQPGVPAQPNPLDPDFVRPFARWNLMTKADNPDNRNNSTQWRCWADQADGPQRRVRGDVAITHDARLGQGGTKNFTARGYRIALKKFLARYGGPDGVVDNLMAWNEPQYEGTGRKDGKGRPNKGSPLKRKPLLAARVWAQAMRACFPSSGPLCGHYTAGGQFEAGRVVAGDFAGMKRDKALRQRGSKRSYTVHYFNEIKRAAAKLTRGGYRRKLPRVWSFHNYGDYKIFALRGGRAARKMTITRRYMRAYRSDDYEFFDTGKRRKPAIWLTEVGHNYHVNCASLQKLDDRRRFCGPEASTKRVSLFGMRRQAKTMGFMLKAITNDFYPQIRRIYYFNLRTRRSCGAPRLGDFTCPLSEFGLLGAEDDDIYRSKLPAGGTFLSVKGGSDKANYSSNGARGLSFGLVRDRAETEKDRGARWVSKPGRVNRTNCPADPR